MLKKYNDYMRIKNCRVEYKLSNGDVIVVPYLEENFAHFKSDYLLFEEKENKEYNHLGIAIDQNTGKRYFETFFHQSNDMYISGQNIVKVNGFVLYDSNNQIIVHDSF